MLQGRDEILRYLRMALEIIPAGVVKTTALFTGINMVVWVWDVGADVMLFDDDGLIVRHHVTARPPPPG
jgi:hypothetical protein